MNPIRLNGDTACEGSELSFRRWDDTVCEPCGAESGLFRAHHDWGWPICEECRLNHIASQITVTKEEPQIIIAGGFFKERGRIAHFDEPCIYFVRFGELVKIGGASDLSVRLSSLQTGSPVPLALIATASPRGLEKAYHEHFRRFRSHGEWFRLSSEQVFSAPGVAPVLPSEADFEGNEDQDESAVDACHAALLRAAVRMGVAA